MDHTIVKTRSFFICQASVLSRECPYVQKVFLYRAPRKNIASFMAMVASFSFLFHKFVFPAWLEIMFDTLQDSSDYYPMSQEMKRQLQRDTDSLKVFAAYYALHIRSYLDCRHAHGVDFHLLSYEDLVLRPEHEMRALLGHCKMPLDNITGSLEAMKKDSQRNSVFSKDSLKSSRPKEFTAEEVKAINQVMVKFDLPELDNYRNAFADHR